MQKLNSLKENRGITLIVLIITVVVMLILAAVVLKTSVGDNGLIGRAEDATNRHLEAENHELNVLNKIDNKYDEIAERIDSANSGNTGNNTPNPTTPTERPGKPNANGIYTENSTINGRTSGAFNPEIPKGFKPVDIDDAVWGDGSNAPTQDAVRKGLVIEDDEGNQFVWVAVDNTTVKLDRYTFANDGSEVAQGTAGISGSFGNSFQELASSDGNTVAQSIDNFNTSVANHGGYYIARYEASYGTDGKPNSKISTEVISENGVASAPTKTGQLWNNITQPDAATACRNMYDSSYGVISDLINSYAWDTTILFIQEYSGDTDYSLQTSSNTTLSNTGSNGDEQCHIQDIASNCLEWSTETYSSAATACVYRGGYCAESTSPSSYRGYFSKSDANSFITFRPILYLV